MTVMNPLITEEQFMYAMSIVDPAKLRGKTVEQVVVVLAEVLGIKPQTNDESLEQYIHRKYEEARRDPEYQRQAAMIDACTDSDDNLDVAKLRRLREGEEPFEQ